MNLTSLLALLVTLTGLAVEAKTIRLKASDHPQVSASRIQAALEKLKPHSVLLIGEDHRDVVGKALVTQALAGFRPHEPGRCYWVEEDPKFQTAFDLLRLDPLKASALHRQIFAEEIPAFTAAYGRPPAYWTDFENLGIISRSGYRIFAVDRTAAQSSRETEAQLSKKAYGPTATAEDVARFEFVLVGKRNEIMAQNIDRLIQQQECRSGALVVGKAHLYERSRHSRFGFQTIQDHLSAPAALVNVAECHRRGACDQNLDWADLNILIETSVRPSFH